MNKDKIRFEEFKLKFSGKSFRLIAFQPLSLSIEIAIPFELSIQGIQCRLALRPAHDDKAFQLTQGGTYIGIEFSTEKSIDLFSATQLGVDLIEDFFAALSLIEMATFRATLPVQIMVTDQIVPQEHIFMHYFDLAMNHWPKPISEKTFKDVQSILAHWDGLETGKRLRRAARQFQRASGTDDDVLAFQYAFMGLEAAEKPLADVMKIPSGVEEVEGHCQKCGEKYIRKRTVLAGIRAYVSGAAHPDDIPPDRKRDWKEINELRHNIFHSLQDIKKLEKKVNSVLPAAMHYLHDAICCLSHSHHLESPTFKLPRGLPRLVFIGKFKTIKLESLDKCLPLIGSGQGYWVPHPQHGFVPRFEIHNSGMGNLEGYFFWSQEPLKTATKENLVPANFENQQNVNEQILTAKAKKPNSADVKARVVD